jgi:hypothetical protein
MAATCKSEGGGGGGHADRNDSLRAESEPPRLFFSDIKAICSEILEFSCTKAQNVTPYGLTEAY